MEDMIAIKVTPHIGNFPNNAVTSVSPDLRHSWKRVLLLSWRLQSGPQDFRQESKMTEIYWLVVSTHLKNISQIGSFPQGSGWKKIETTT